MNYRQIITGKLFTCRQWTFICVSGCRCLFVTLLLNWTLSTACCAAGQDSQRNNEARSCNRYRSGKSVIVTYSDCDFVALII